MRAALLLAASSMASALISPPALRYAVVMQRRNRCCVYQIEQSAPQLMILPMLATADLDSMISAVENVGNRFGSTGTAYAIWCAIVYVTIWLQGRGNVYVFIQT